MTNIEKYNKLHDEIIKRLEAGEITTEQAKEINDLAFGKYIIESSDENDDKFPNSVKLDFFNKTWNCKVVINHYDKDEHELPNVKIINDFIKNSKQISKNIENEFCLAATKEYSQWSKTVVKTYSEIKPLKADMIYLKYINNKWHIVLCGEWDPDIEHGFSLLFDGKTLINILDAAAYF